MAGLRALDEEEIQPEEDDEDRESEDGDGRVRLHDGTELVLHDVGGDLETVVVGILVLPVPGAGDRFDSVG